MCGRYTYFSSADLLKQFDFSAQANEQVTLALQIPDNYNVSPGAHMPVIVRGEQGHRIELMQWGLVPAWSKEPETALKLINARAEGLLEKPMWKRLVAAKRCVVPARGFYEWQVADGKKLPFYITPARGEVMSIAGLWDEWQDASGMSLLTYSIITTTPNTEMKAVHNRMPAILTQQQMDAWLSHVALSQSELDDVLASPADGTLHIVRVSTKVNNARNNGADLIYPLPHE